jgi:hypothetical protein
MVKMVMSTKLWWYDVGLARLWNVVRDIGMGKVVIKREVGM